MHPAIYSCVGAHACDVLTVFEALHAHLFEEAIKLVLMLTSVVCQERVKMTSLTDMYEYLNSEQILTRLCGTNTVMRDEIVRISTAAGKHRMSLTAFLVMIYIAMYVWFAVVSKIFGELQ